MQCIVNMLNLYEFKMQNSSPDSDPAGSSILYNDSGYLTHHNTDLQSYSSNSNSDPSFETSEELSLHKPLESVQSSSGIYFCEDAVFDEPKLEGPPLLSHNTNNYEQFSSLIKFSLEETSTSYLNETNLLQDSSNSSYYVKNPTVLQYFDQDSLSSYSSINPSQPICVSENKENIVSQAVEQCLTLTQSDTELSQISQSVNSKLDCTDNSATKTDTFTDHVDDPLSPELFSEDDDEEESLIEIDSAEYGNISFTQKRASLDENSLKNDRILLKRVQETLSGVPPPPSVTILQLSANELLNKIKSNFHLFLKVDDVRNKESTTKSLLVSNTKEEIKGIDFPEIMNYRYHGLHFNRSCASEDLESSCMRYLTRYVGCETASTVTACGTGSTGSSTAAVRRLRGPPKSPGRRLAHLARRRITFSSANLQQATGGGLSVLGNGLASKQLMIDPRKSINRRKSPRKSPWKRSPRKTPSKRTPSNRVSSTKRALFQSPDKPPAVVVKKRALFQSPSEKSTTPSASGKRKRQAEDEGCRKNKMARSLSLQEETVKKEGLIRRSSEGCVKKGELSDLHRQKLLWAVSAALRSHGISSSHSQFRSFASVLCKIVKYFVPDLTSGAAVPRQAGSTSERLLRLARKHCHAVTRGQSAQEVIQAAEATSNKEVNKGMKGFGDCTSRQATSSVVSGEKGMRQNERFTTVKRQICFDEPNR